MFGFCLLSLYNLIGYVGEWNIELVSRKKMLSFLNIIKVEIKEIICIKKIMNNVFKKNQIWLQKKKIVAHPFILYNLSFVCIYYIRDL